MAEPLQQITQFTQWLANLLPQSHEEAVRYGAWASLLFAAFCFYHLIKGLWTGSIWNPELKNSDLAQILDPGPERHDRDTDGFNFWLTAFAFAVIGILSIAISVKSFW